jgi:hypothetical protein
MNFEGNRKGLFYIPVGELGDMHSKLLIRKQITDPLPS